MGRFRSTNKDLLKKNSSYNAKKLYNEDDEDKAKEFSENIINQIVDDNSLTVSEARASVIDLGGIMLILVFKVDPENEDDGDLVEARAALNLFGCKWEIVPGAIGDWIVGRYLEFISNAIDEIDFPNDEDD